MSDETVEYRPGGRHEIPYRARPLDPPGTVERQWQIEYQQNPKDAYWGPRGVFTEVDGYYQWAGKTFSTVRSVLVYRANNPV